MEQESEIESADSVESTLENVKNLMKDLESNGPDRLIIVLEETLVIADVRDFYAIWGSYLKDERDVAIHTSNIKQVDSAGLQLLIAFVTSKIKQGKTINWVGQSEVFEEVITLLDMKKVLAYAS